MTSNNMPRKTRPTIQTTTVRREGQPTVTTTEHKSEHATVRITSIGEMSYCVVHEGKVVRAGKFGGATEAKLTLKPNHAIGEVLWLRVGGQPNE
jgi:hypothetical protein